MSTSPPNRTAVIAVLNQKGGSGKTTLALHLAAAMAERHRVLLVDADPQGSALDWTQQRESAPPFATLALPRPTLHRDLPAVASDYDRVFIDGPPQSGALARSAATVADLVLVPVQPSPLDLWAAHDMLEILEEADAVRDQPLRVRLVINRLFPRTRLGREIRTILDELGVAALPTAIRNRTEYAAAFRAGLTALESASSGPAARDMRTLADEVLEALDGR